MTSSTKENAILPKEGPFKPFTGKNITYYYMPMQGALCYTALSVNTMCPSLMLRGFHQDAILHALVFETMLGTGLYFYGRQHLLAVSTAQRLFFSAFGAFAFTMSSLQLWHTLRSIIPGNLALCAACGVGSGLALMILGRYYINHVDSEYEY